METSQLDLNYESWETFGQDPSINHYFNMLVNVNDDNETPFFSQGQYEHYYCLIDRSMIYDQFKF